MKRILSAIPAADIHETVVVVIRKKDPDGYDEVLMGESLNKFCKGLFIAPGGHVDPGEHMHHTCCHEVLDEVGLVIRIEDLICIGTFVVTYGSGMIVRMHFFEVRRWKGRPVPNPKDFKPIDFGFHRQSEIPRNIPPRDREIWAAIFNDTHFDATMKCGKGLQDVISFEMKTRPRMK